MLPTLTKSAFYILLINKRDFVKKLKIVKKYRSSFTAIIRTYKTTNIL